MKNPTYREQFNKIVRAYLGDELNPMSNCACFVGNLLNGCNNWRHLRWNRSNEDGLKVLQDEANNLYTPLEICELECSFLGTENRNMSLCLDKRAMPDYEDRLYRAMERALLHLRRLHESKGEVIEDYDFTRRDLSLIKS